MSRPGRSMFGVELRTVDDRRECASARRQELGQAADPRRCGRQALLQAGGGLRRCRTVVRYRRRRRDPSRRHDPDHRSRKGRDQVGRRMDQLDRARECRGRLSRRRRSRGDRHPASQVGRAAAAAGRARSGKRVCEPRKSAISLPEQVAKWWLPDAIEFVDELPHTATGKLSKKDLRDQYRDYRFAECGSDGRARLEKARAVA